MVAVKRAYQTKLTWLTRLRFNRFKINMSLYVLNMCSLLLFSCLKAALLLRIMWSNTLFARRCLEVRSNSAFCSHIVAWHMAQTMTLWTNANFADAPCRIAIPKEKQTFSSCPQPPTPKPVRFLINERSDSSHMAFGSHTLVRLICCHVKPNQRENATKWQLIHWVGPKQTDNRFESAQRLF